MMKTISDIRYLRYVNIFLLVMCIPAFYCFGQVEIKALAKPVSCYGKKDGKIILEFTNNRPPVFKIIVTDSFNLVIDNFDTLIGKQMQIENLSAAKYTISLTSDEVNEKQEVTINSPDPLELEIIKIIKTEGNGELSTASLQAFPVGGTIPYIYQWSENTGNQNTAITTSLPLGVYNCKVFDNKGCGPTEATFYLFDDEIKKFNEENNSN